MLALALPLLIALSSPPPPSSSSSTALCDELEVSVLRCARAHASDGGLARCTKDAGPALTRCRAKAPPATPTTTATSARFSYADFVAAGEEPLVLGNLRVTSGYGPRRDPITGKRSFHHGVDLTCHEGDPLATPVSGVVSASTCGTDGRGCYVSIKYGKRTLSLFHLARPSFVPIGAWLRKDVDVAGICSHTGRATGPHTHVELRDALDDRVDPSWTIFRASR